jgi:hypothetical protein
MRTTPLVTSAVIVLTILIASPMGVVAQGGTADGAETIDTRPECIATVVRDAPFSAEAVTAWHPPANSGKAELRSVARYYRDGAGRVRVDFVEGMSPQRVMIVPDADSRVAYFLDTAARTIIKSTRGMLGMIVGSAGCFNNHFVLPLSMRRFISFHASPLDEESLGQRPIGGVQTTGTRFTMTLPAGVRGMGRGERWVSSELNLVVYGRREDSEAGIVEHRLRRITRADPAAALFEVPSDYVETAFPCMTWENPYKPHAGGHECGDR